jgi:hypothetical protein
LKHHQRPASFPDGDLAAELRQRIAQARFAILSNVKGVKVVAGDPSAIDSVYKINVDNLQRLAAATLGLNESLGIPGPQVHTRSQHPLSIAFEELRFDKLEVDFKRPPEKPDEDWRFTATVSVQPKPEPADWTQLEVPAPDADVPQELVEAAEVDGARAWDVFRRVTFPLVKPIFIIVASLSIIWDFQVFNQVWIARGGEPSEEYFLMAVYAFVEAFKVQQYGLGSAIAVVMVAIMFGVTFFYIREMVRIGEVKR